MAAVKPNPVRLASLAIAGAFLAASSWFLNFLPIHRVHDPCLGLWATMWANRLTFVTLAFPFLSGLWLMFWAEKRLKKGFVDDVWNDAELAPVRSLLEKPIWMWSTVLLMVGCVLQMILFSNAHGGGAFFYVLALPLQTVGRTKQLVAPPKVAAGGLKDWRSFKPIRSEHWGERRNEEQLSA